MNNLENDIAKYKKRKDSSTSKSKAKSKHKHEYVDCLFIKNRRPYRGIYCKLCGKIGNVKYKILNDDDEIFERHKDWDQIPIDNIWQKYVSLSENIEGETE